MSDVTRRALADFLASRPADYEVEDEDFASYRTARCQRDECDYCYDPECICTCHRVEVFPPPGGNRGKESAQ